MKCLIFYTKFYRLYIRHMTRRFVVQRFYGHVTLEDVPCGFLISFFDNLKYINYVFLNIDIIYFEKPKKKKLRQRPAHYFHFSTMWPLYLPHHLRPSDLSCLPAVPHLPSPTPSPNLVKPPLHFVPLIFSALPRRIRWP
jgi:hypothetical protein